MTGTLHIVATPIGNLGDLSERARQTLADVDLVVAEDTRRTGRLLAAFGVEASLRSMFDGNERERTPGVLRDLMAGRSVALVSDGGMPLVSDPGYRLVHACIEEGIDVRVVPGPSAALAALVVSGLPTDRFVFEGFLPRASGQRRTRLAAIAQDPRTLVLFEAPRRVAGLLRDIALELGDRRVAVCRELTKLHEQVLRGSVTGVLEELGEQPVRGEVVVVVEGNRVGAPVDLDAAVVEARALIDGGTRNRDAARRVAAHSGVPANAIYSELVGETGG
ncbi:MAG: 16S rRNA (cytidine(1402)-2'-O)-methyltransferase [Actinomycetota bacterium]|nr:16S rRNA (cytidine(1402)-2'-O)-methyltransferase [Actinomycetota bacterium]